VSLWEKDEPYGLNQKTKYSWNQASFLGYLVVFLQKDAMSKKASLDQNWDNHKSFIKIVLLEA
jgi:hypothetical protein